MHSTGLYHSPDLYVKLIEALGRHQHWELALELFLSMQASHLSIHFFDCYCGALYSRKIILLQSIVLD